MIFPLKMAMFHSYVSLPEDSKGPHEANGLLRRMNNQIMILIASIQQWSIGVNMQQLQY